MNASLTGAHFAAPATATYEWAFGDGATGTGITATHAYSAAGRYPVTLTVKDGATVLGTATQPVSTSGGAVTVTGPAHQRAGENATFTATTTPARDLTFEVYRRTTPTTYTRVLQKPTTGSLTYASPVAASDVVVACVEKTCGDPANLKPGAGSASIDWTYKPGADGWAELWDGESLAGWSTTGTGSITRNFLTSLATAGGATSASPGTLWYSARQFKDFELSVDYRTAATNNNGGVLLRFPAPATVADIDRGGYQVAILDSGTGASPVQQRSGSITQERVTPTTFAVSARRTALQADARVEHADDQGRALAHHRVGQRRAGQHVRQRDPQRPRRLHRARERRQQPDVPQRAGARARARHRRPDGRDRLADRRRATASGSGHRAQLRVHGRVGAGHVHGDARRRTLRAAARSRRPRPTSAPTR